jgi:hypothetical protein
VTATPTADALTAAVREELVMLWGDLTSAVRYAANGSWSIQCDNLAERITVLSRLVGPTPWDEIDVGTLLSGVYERVHREAGIEVPPIDWERVRQVDEGLRNPGGMEVSRG